MSNRTSEERNLADKLLSCGNEREIRAAIRQALRSGADLNAVVDEASGNSVLHIIAKAGRADLLKACQIAGGDLGSINSKGETPYGIAGGSARQLREPKKIGEYFSNLEKGIYPASKEEAKTLSFFCNKEGQRALHIAARIGDLSLAKYIVKDAPYLTWDNSERSPLHYAVIGGHEPIVRLLLESLSCKDEIINPDCAGMTPLHYAAKYGNADLLHTFINVRKVVEGGIESTLLVDSVIKAANGRQLWRKKLIHLAAESGCDTCIKMLLSYVQNKRLMILAKDDEGKTPEAIAGERGYRHIVKLLQQYHPAA